VIPGHEKPLDASHCSLCASYHSDSRYRVIVDRVSAGIAVPKEGLVSECIHLGEPLPGLLVASLKLSNERNWRTCEIGHGEPAGIVCQCNGCGPKCRDYVPEDLSPAQMPTAFVAREGDPLVGVVIGSYGWPGLIDLQIRCIRQTCGDVPILVSDDCSPNRDKIAAVCLLHGVDYISGEERIGHTGGDVSAFYRGVCWAADRGLKAIAKLSQRFVGIAGRWLHDGAIDLLASGLAIATQRCRGKENFPLRTEAVLVDVGQWNRPAVLDRIKPRRYWNDKPGGLNAEQIIYDLMREELGGMFWPWKLFGEDRYRISPDFLWHCYRS